jgi:hypothetical protein
LCEAPGQAPVSGFRLGAGYEEEQLTGLATMVENNLADCVHGQHEQAIHILDLPMPEPPPKGAEWIAAYRHWAR